MAKIKITTEKSLDNSFFLSLLFNFLILEQMPECDEYSIYFCFKLSLIKFNPITLDEHKERKTNEKI